MGITSDKNSQPPKESKGRSYFGDLPKIIEECIELFGEDGPLTKQFRQELIDLTQEKRRRENNPNHYEEEEWHAGMVPNLRPKSEKGLEEEESWDDELEESPEDSPTMDLEASKVMDDFEYDIDEGRVLITGYLGAGGDVIVPSTLNRLPVTNIGHHAFKGCRSRRSRLWRRRRRS